MSLTASLGIAGFGLAVVSLGWQVVTWRLSGARVVVTVDVMEHRRLGSSLAVMTELLRDDQPEGRYLQVTARNRGRGPVTVDKVMVSREGGGAWYLSSEHGTALPCRLEPYASAAWRFYLANREMDPAAVDGAYFAVVGLGHGGIRHSRGATWSKPASRRARTAIARTARAEGRTGGLGVSQLRRIFGRRV